MGRATRWLKGLFGTSKDKEFAKKQSSGGFCSNNPSTTASSIPVSEAARLGSYYAETEVEQNKHAIAVAAATAAAADAAVAAAQAAVEVVRLTSHGRGTMFVGGPERYAAEKIQAVFRGYLARKALRALKGVVKLQALVRGFLVRKRAVSTLHSIQALMRAQAAARSRRARLVISSGGHHNNRHDVVAPMSVGRPDDMTSEHSLSVPAHSRRLSSSSIEPPTVNAVIDEFAPRIVEVDYGKPRSRSRRTVTSLSDLHERHHQNQSQRHPYPMSPSSPLPARTPTRNSRISDWATEDLLGLSTAQSTPRFAITPAKSESFFRGWHPNTWVPIPNYMADTQSSKAKLRSQSAPRQRTGMEAAIPSKKKRASLQEVMMECSRSSVSGDEVRRMQRSCSHGLEGAKFKNSAMEKMEFAELERKSCRRPCGDERRW